MIDTAPRRMAFGTSLLSLVLIAPLTLPGAVVGTGARVPEEHLDLAFSIVHPQMNDLMPTPLDDKGILEIEDIFIPDLPMPGGRLPGITP